MQSVSSRIWTHVAVSISYYDKHYTTDTYILLTNYYDHVPNQVELKYRIFLRNLFIIIIYKFSILILPPSYQHEFSLNFYVQLRVIKSRICFLFYVLDLGWLGSR